MAATLLERYEPSQPALDGIVEDGTPNPVLCREQHLLPSSHTPVMASSETEAPFRSSRDAHRRAVQFYLASERALRHPRF